MIRFIVMVKLSTGKIEPLGSHEFAVPPRVGEFVTMNDEDGIGQAYQVAAVVHPLDPATDAGDLILKYFSTDVEMIKNA